MLGMRRIIGPAVKDIIERENDKVLFATADTGRYYAYDDLLRTYPEHVVDVGIAEQNLIGASAGLQNEGFNVFAITYATFLTARALDQIRVNLGYMGLGVKLLGEAGGMADGNFSVTHMALEDISNTRNIPNMTVVCPADGISEEGERNIRDQPDAVIIHDFRPDRILSVPHSRSISYSRGNLL